MGDDRRSIWLPLPSAEENVAKVLTISYIDGMRAYFEQFGDVTHCTIMRDPHTDRSRGFGFLTFRDSAAVNVVMVKEHHLDGKIVRRAVRPRFRGAH